MDTRVRADTLKYLKKVEQSVKAAETLFDAGEYLPAVRTLTEARRLGGQATAVLMAECLRRVLDDASNGDRYAREKCLDELVRLVGFIESALCPACRRRVAARLKER